MFSIFKKHNKNDPLRALAQNMKSRSINFVDDDFDGLCKDTENDRKAVLRLEPVNYYAVKQSYITGIVYSSSDMSENLIEFIHIDGDLQTGRSRLYTLDKETTVKLLAKVGIMV